MEGGLLGEITKLAVQLVDKPLRRERELVLLQLLKMEELNVTDQVKKQWNVVFRNVLVRLFKLKRNC